MSREFRVRFEFTMDRYTDMKLNVIVDGLDFLTRAEAVKVAILHFADHVERGEIVLDESFKKRQIKK